MVFPWSPQSCMATLKRYFFIHNHQCKHSHSIRKNTSEASQEALGLQRSSSRPGREEPPLSSPDLSTLLCSQRWRSLVPGACACPGCLLNTCWSLDWLWDDAVGKEERAEWIMHARNVSKLPAHPSQGLSAFWENQFDLFVWLRLSDWCLSPCQPSATSFLVLHAHTAKTTCSQPLAATHWLSDVLDSDIKALIPERGQKL